MKHGYGALTFVTAALCISPLAAAQQDNITQQDNGRKTARAVRVPAGAIDVDGRLAESVWQTIPAITEFVQKEPVEGTRPTDQMEVRFAYDDTALYVGARMHAGGGIQAPMGRRDNGDQAEHLLISLDTYLDRRTSSTFGVTASGVRLDRYYASDRPWDDDDSFDPVWQARTSVDTQGWVAELWIPFSQLRFTDRSPQVWGLNIQRWIPSRNEEVYWALISRTEERWASLFGDLHGIDGITPSRRLEIMPYVASSAHVIGDRDRDDPFTGGGNLEGRIGVDAKMGLGSNLTLEATVNPDFGQVEADPAEVNLSAFETFFSERRPFFVEGNDLLTGNVNNYFYSRRIGAPPAGRASADFVEYPGTSTILGAAKLTGRLESGLSVGMLGAVTAEESARTFDAPGLFGRTRVAPRTTYGVTRLQQQFGSSGSTTAMMATAVHRDIAEGDPLASLLARNAFTLSSDSVIRLRDGDYEMQVNGGVTYVGGDAPAIDRLQRASARYLQRPDAAYTSYDPRRTSMTGMKLIASVERSNARHWSWEVGTDIESPEFETNDIGRLGAGDGIVGSGEIEYQETVPGRWWRQYSFTLQTRNEWNYGGDRQQAQWEPGVEITWPNFWQTELSGTINPRTQDQRLTRGGPSMEKPANWEMSLSVESSESSRTRGDVEATYGRNEDGGLMFNVNGGITMQPGSRWQLSIGPQYERQIDTQQYVATLAGGGPATYGGRYVFAHIDRSTYSTEFRWNYTFKPDLTLDFYGEPFAASGRYDHIGELMAARTRQLRVYGTDGTTLTTLADGTRRVTDGSTGFTLRNPDFNVQSFRSNLVLRWEWRAGSALYLVWQQDRELELLAPERVSAGDMFSSLGRRGDNFFAIKVAYWFSPN
ncbi:MAG TPA: DUF5916 domain-containing protein [Vicinamibacterales bacterium]